jgi:hypothetical protein
MLLKPGVSLWMCAMLVKCALNENHKEMYVEVRQQENQHWVRWRSLGDTQRQARELISGPGLGAKTILMSFNRTQSRAVIGLLTGHNTLRWHLLSFRTAGQSIV